MRWGRGPKVTRLSHKYLDDALAICERDPVASILAAVNLRSLRFASSSMLGFVQGDLKSIMWSGANLIPVATTPEQRERYADFLAPRVRRSSSIVGPAEEVMDMADLLRHSWGEPREVRAHQPSMVATSTTSQPDEQVRLARAEDGGIVTPASVAMFTEEVGYDPTTYGPSYIARVFDLCKKGHTMIRTGIGPDGHERVEFKADVGALANGVAQIQGVWVAPDLRGQGLATAGMAAVINIVTSTIAPTVSLYVNDYNDAALAVYRKVGFKQVGEFATVSY